jgi:hypothetical protein
MSEIKNASGDLFEEFRLRLHSAPGSSMDFLATFEPRYYRRLLRGKRLEVSAAFGFRLVAYGAEPLQGSVYIALPPSRTVGDLLAAMFQTLAPVMLLYSLRHVADFDREAPTWKNSFDKGLAVFIDAIAQGDTQRFQAIFRECWKEAMGRDP